MEADGEEIVTGLRDRPCSHHDTRTANASATVNVLVTTDRINSPHEF
jgi:hypothetical protein